MWAHIWSHNIQAHNASMTNLWHGKQEPGMLKWHATEPCKTDTHVLMSETEHKSFAGYKPCSYAYTCNFMISHKALYVIILRFIFASASKGLIRVMDTCTQDKGCWVTFCWQTRHSSNLQLCNRCSSSCEERIEKKIELLDTIFADIKWTNAMFNAVKSSDKAHTCWECNCSDAYLLSSQLFLTQHTQNRALWAITEVMLNGVCV